MNAGERKRKGLLRRTLPLQVKVAMFLGLALFPLGLISVLQTTNFVRETQALSRAALLGQTERSAAQEQSAIYEALGTAAALGEMVLNSPDAESCSASLKKFIDKSDAFVFAGLTDTNGMMVCASSGTGQDFSELPLFREQLKDPHPLVNLFTEGAITGEPIIVATRPVFADPETLVGVLSVSFPLKTMSADLVDTEAESRGFTLAFFDRFGQVITADPEAQDGVLLPAAFAAEDFFGTEPRTFQSMTRTGELRSFAVVPLIENGLYAISSWRSEDAWRTSMTEMLAPLTFPLLICVVSLAVAYLSVNRLVVAPVSRLRRRINRFAAGSRDLETTPFDDAPQELRELAERFDRLARSVAADEVAREEALREKTLLLKEVYHRVKNNLQLIVSIMNMQIRNAKTDRERALLQQLQERVMSLSIIHRNLYEASSLTELHADRLLTEIVAQLRSAVPEASGSSVETDFEDISLLPDQAVPLSLLVSEAGSNALRHNDWGRPDAFVSFRLAREDSDRIVLEIGNSRSAVSSEPTAAYERGLGRRLIDAFARQMNGEMEIEETDGRYVLRVVFNLQRLDDSRILRAAQ